MKREEKYDEMFRGVEARTGPGGGGGGIGAAGSRVARGGRGGANKDWLAGAFSAGAAGRLGGKPIVAIDDADSELGFIIRKEGIGRIVPSGRVNAFVNVVLGAKNNPVS